MQLVVQKIPEIQRFILNEWRFRMRAFRLFLCLEIVFIGLPYFILYETFDIFSEIRLSSFVSILVVFVVLPFIVFWKSKVHPHIVIEDCVEIPRLFFWIRKVEFESISSFEEMKIKEKDFGVLVGLRTGSLINYEESDFKDEEDYRRFKQCIYRILKLNRSSPNFKVLQIEPISLSQNVLLLLILSAWLTTYLLLTNSLQLDFYASLGSGALSKNVLSGEQIYRVASSFFLHLNSIHISMNILSFAIFGQFLLRVVDLYRFLCILLLSALIASILTLMLSPYEAIIGASGGIMGVFGAYCCLKLLRYLPGSISSSSNTWVLFFIAVQVALEYFVEGIDSYTHAGGFLTGFVYMWFCIKNEYEHSVFKSSLFEKVAACALTLCYLGGLFVFLLKIYGGV